MKSNKYICVLAVSILFSFMPAIVRAQDPTCNPDDPSCPLDSGVFILIIAAVGIALKKYWESRKRTAVL